MGQRHRLDTAVGIGAQRGLDPGRIGRALAAEVEPPDLHPHRLGRQRPAKAEAAGQDRQRMIPAREDIGVRRLPPAMAVGDVDRHMRVGQRHAPEVGDHGAGQVVQSALIDIRRGPVHGPQHPVGHDRGAGNGKVGPTVGQGHGRDLRLSGTKA